MTVPCIVQKYCERAKSSPRLLLAALGKRGLVVGSLSRLGFRHPGGVRLHRITFTCLYLGTRGATERSQRKLWVGWCKEQRIQGTGSDGLASQSAFGYRGQVCLT